MTQRRVRCAIYTRKSTEEGLDQAFNSLDAQREACQAYVVSQSGEGWVLVPNHYDDGGFSGGNTERPALRKLLDDIDHGRVDVVMVYKIDRLTRSLADFAKIVERFDKRNVSFVSVTQAFNTTSSMGRLTLNVLLSFAQFEREVTAERIRDKFSASRKKGIFMGGNPPLGYDAKSRKLVINPTEAETVRLIFRRYLELGSVAQLRVELDSNGIRTKSWVSTRGKAMGGGRWYTGPLRHILRNRVYAGDAMHKGTAHTGEHDPIISRDLFDAVQTKLTDNRTSYHRKKTIGSQGLLTGLIFDDRGNAMSPTKSRRPGGKSYLYYVSQARLQRREPDAMRPVPALIVEDIIRNRLSRIMDAETGRVDPSVSYEEMTGSALRDLIRRLVARIKISYDCVSIIFNTDAIVIRTALPLKRLSQELRTNFPTGDRIEIKGQDLFVSIPVRLWVRGGIRRVEGWDRSDWATFKPRRDSALIKALARAHEWREWIESGRVSTLDDLATRTGHDRKYAHATLKLAFLSPDIQQAIFAGRQPGTLTLTTLGEGDLPMLWTEQRTLLHCPVQTPLRAKMGCDQNASETRG